MSRELDLTLLGATGFTGGLVAGWLAHHAPPTLRWALAGRDADRLARVREGLTEIRPALADLPLHVVDSHDDRALARLAARTRVVCTTVGPYLAHGLPLAGACAEAGTHSVDLTGETPYMRRTIDALHARAAATGARIVHACGYDSIPSDLGTFVVQEAMRARGAPATRVTTFVGPARGGVSGGTVASLLGVLEAAADPAVRRALADPYCLDPAGDPRGVDGRDPVAPAWEPLVDQWTAPFFMAPVNTRVVRRSHALLGRPWGPRFSYRELLLTGPGWTGRATATAIVAALGAFLGLASTAAGRRALSRTVLPSPGQGPSPEARARGFFRHLLTAVGDDPAHRCVGRVIGQGDPGYAATALMLGASALTLALEEDALPDRAGVLTPATGIGAPLVQRLRAAGMVLEASDWPDAGAPRP